MEQRPTTGSFDPRYERKAVVLLGIGFGLVGLDRWIIAPLFPVMMEDLNLTYQDLGTITAVLAITWGLFSIITGGLSDRIGRRKIIIPAVVGFSVLAGFTGLAGGLGGLLVIRAIMGVFEGAFTPTSNVATLEASRPSRRGFNMGIQQSGFALLGLGFGPIVATQLLVVLPSWHWVFVVVALPGLVVAYLLWRVLREPPHIRQRSAAFADVPAQDAEPRRWREIFSYRNVVLGTLVLFGAFSCIFVISAMVPSYLTDYIRLSLTEMGFVTSAIGFGGTLGFILVPAISDRVGRKAAVGAAFVIAAVALIAFAFVGANPALLFVLLFVIAGCSFGAITTVATLVVPEAVPTALLASAAGIPIGAGEIFGGGVAPIVGGFVAQNYGIQNTLYVALFGLFVGFAITFLLKETAPSKTGQRVASEPAVAPPVMP